VAPSEGLIVWPREDPVRQTHPPPGRANAGHDPLSQGSMPAKKMFRETIFRWDLVSLQKFWLTSCQLRNRSSKYCSEARGNTVSTLQHGLLLEQASIKFP